MSIRRFKFGVHPSVEMVAKWVATLKHKTGRSVEEWVALTQAEGPAGEKDRRDWLKRGHGLGTNSAWWLAERSVGNGGEADTPEAYLATAERYVEEMFAGPKAALAPLYEALMDTVHVLGADVRACPCKTIVPLYRNHVFAQIKPTTRTRIDFGLALGDRLSTGRLIDTGGFAKKDRITHRIAVSSLNDIDTELKRWLRAAYDLDR